MHARDNLYPDLRGKRAMAITSYVMIALEPWLDRLDRLEIWDQQTRAPEHRRAPHTRRDVHEKLFELFCTVGAEVITEADRINAGLDPRDRFGLTERELAVLDDGFMQSMRGTQGNMRSAPFEPQFRQLDEAAEKSK